MNKEEIISSGLLESYAMGSTSHEETLQVEWWAKTYPEVQAELASIELAMEKYAFQHAVTPSPSSRANILAAIAGEAKTQTPVRELSNPAGIAPVRRMYSPWKIAAAASIILLVGSAILNFVFYNKYQDANNAYVSASNELIAKDQSLASLNEDISVVKNKYSVPVALNGLEAAPEAAAKIFWMKNTGDVYIDPSNLPEAPEGMQYQLWGIVDGKPVDGGMILKTTTGDVYNIQKMKNFGHAEAFAVTLETKGGHEQPEGTMFVLGKM